MKRKISFEDIVVEVEENYFLGDFKSISIYAVGKEQNRVIFEYEYKRTDIIAPVRGHVKLVIYNQVKTEKLLKIFKEFVPPEWFKIFEEELKKGNTVIHRYIY